MELQRIIREDVRNFYTFSSCLGFIVDKSKESFEIKSFQQKKIGIIEYGHILTILKKDIESIVCVSHNVILKK